MRKLLPTLLLALGLAGPALAGDAWTGLQAGMTNKQAAALTGQPLFANVARGFEVWFFDHRGEVTLYRGRVMYWSAPQPAVGRAVAAPAVAPVVVEKARPALLSVSGQPPDGRQRKT